MIIRNEEMYLIENVIDANKMLLYIPLRGVLFNIDKETAIAIQNENEVIIDMLMKEIDDMTLASTKDINKTIDMRAPTISLNLSDNCMLRCIYCYMCSCKCDSSREMTFEQAKSVVDSFVDYALNTLKIKKIKFSFFGGAEPTYNVKLFKDVIEYIKSQAKLLNFDYIFGMTTNGFYSESLMDYIIENFNSVTYSFDGPELVQNVHRPTVNNVGSFDMVLQNAKKLYNSGLKFSFRTTVSKITLVRWKEVMDFFITNFKGCDVHLAPLLPIGRGADSDIVPILPTEWEEIAPQIYEYSKGLIKVEFPNVCLPSNLKLHFCGAATSRLWIVSNDGTVSTCPHDRLNPIHIIGKFDFDTSKLSINEEKVTDIKNRFNVLNYPECADCFCKYTCAGGCPSQKVFGLKPVCELTRKLTKMLFSDFVNG